MDYLVLILLAAVAGLGLFLIMARKIQRKKPACSCGLADSCLMAAPCAAKQSTLDNLKPGCFGEVIALRATGSLRQKLLAMGLTKGCRIEMIKKAPLGDPLEIKIRDFNLSLRKQEASTIIISHRD